MTEPTRRWRAGWRETVDGIEFRVQPGKKKPPLPGASDLVLQWRTPGGRWRPITMNPAALMVEFFYENEEMLYPPSVNPRWIGGQKVVRHIDRAIAHGWQVARDYLGDEKSGQSPIKTLLSIVKNDSPAVSSLPWVWGDYACEECGQQYRTATYGVAVGDLGPARCARDGGRFVLKVA